MIVESALAAAGPGAVLAARPNGVAHVAPAGPLTPSGRFLPRSRRPVCARPTRRLRVVELPPGFATLSQGHRVPRLCALCSARLARTVVHPGPRRGNLPERRAGQTSRDVCRRDHQDLALMDLWLGAVFAETLDEVATVGHLGLLLLGPSKCRKPVQGPGWQRPSLASVIAERRGQLRDTSHADEQWDNHRAAVRLARGSDRDDRKARRGYLNDVRRATTTGASR